MKYFISIGNKYYLGSMLYGNGSQHFYAEKLNIETIKKMNNGLFKYMYSLDEAEKILKKFYRYRKNKRLDYKFNPCIERCSRWLKANKKVI